MITITEEIRILSHIIVENQDVDSLKYLDKDDDHSKRLLGLLLVESLMKHPYNICQNIISPLVMYLSNYLYFSSLENRKRLFEFLRTAKDKKTFEEINDSASMHLDTWQVFTYRLKKYIEAFSEKIPSIKKIIDCEEKILKKIISDTFHAHSSRIDDILEDAYQEKHKDDYDIQLYQREREYDRTIRF